MTVIMTTNNANDGDDDNDMNDSNNNQVNINNNKNNNNSNTNNNKRYGKGCYPHDNIRHLNDDVTCNKITNIVIFNSRITLTIELLSHCYVFNLDLIFIM